MSKDQFLNVGIIQMDICENPVDNLKQIEYSVSQLMQSYHKPELIVGVETIAAGTLETVPGKMTDYFGKIAKKYGIYFIPGTIGETTDDLPPGKQYNTAVVFNPKGELIGKYRKMAPWQPAESMSVPGDDYLVFDIPEKNTKVGVQICYDINFPEISRNLTLMGAEVLVKLTMDPEELYRINDHFHVSRAVENQAYVVSTNGTGLFHENHLYGHSMVVDPEGYRIWEAGRNPCIATVTLDLEKVRRCREHGSLFLDHYLKHLKEFNFPMPYAGDFGSAPIYKTLGPSPKDGEEYKKSFKEKYGLIGADNIEPEEEGIDYNDEMSKFLDSKLKE